MKALAWTMLIVTIISTIGILGYAMSAQAGMLFVEDFLGLAMAAGYVVLCIGTIRTRKA